MAIQAQNLVYWRAVLEGKEPDVTEDPQAGYYRGSWFKGGGLLPIAIWPDGERMRCVVGYKPSAGHENVAFEVDADDLADHWPFFCRNAIPHQKFLSAYNTGLPWPEEATTEDFGEEGEALEGPAFWKQQLGVLEAALKRHLQVNEQGEEWADKTANFRSRILAVRKDVQDAWDAAKVPHNKALKTIKSEHVGFVDQANDLNNQCRKALSDWKTAEDARKRQEFLDEAKKVEAGEKAPEEVAQPQQKKKAGGKTTGGTGRATGFTTVRSAKITDYAAALKHWQENELVIQAVQTLCDRDARAGADNGPGWVVEEKATAR